MDLLTIRDLHLDIQSWDARYHILRGVDLVVRERGALGIVGESGSGKTMTCLTVMRLLPKGSVVTRGQILFAGKNLAEWTDAQIESVRGREIGMIFQDARAALNPVLTVGDQISDIYCHRTGKSRAEGMKKAAQVLDAMGIPSARDRVKSYPHELSGGMCQRVLIAMALVSAPRLLIADEIATGLDVTIQAQVIELVKQVIAELSASLIFVSHDIGVIIEACSEIAVMYCGMVLEQGEINAVLKNPCSPYTAALLDCFQIGSSDRMGFIPGVAPDLKTLTPGCPFAPRCAFTKDICHSQVPQLHLMAPNHWVACHQVDGSHPSATLERKMVDHAGT